MTKDISLAEQIRQSIAGIKNRPAGYSLGPGSMDPSNMVCTVTVFPLDLAARAADEIERLERMHALAKFGALVLDEHRDELGDLDGSWLQQTALECDLLESVTAIRSCGEYCRCAEYGDFPQDCIQKTEFAKALDVPETPK